MNISEWVLLLVGEQRGGGGGGEGKKEGRKEGGDVDVSKGAGGRERLLVVGSVRSSERVQGHRAKTGVQRVTAIPGDYDDDGQGDGDGARRTTQQRLERSGCIWGV